MFAFSAVLDLVMCVLSARLGHSHQHPVWYVLSVLWGALAILNITISYRRQAARRRMKGLR